MVVGSVQRNAVANSSVNFVRYYDARSRKQEKLRGKTPKYSAITGGDRGSVGISGVGALAAAFVFFEPFFCCASAAAWAACSSCCKTSYS